MPLCPRTIQSCHCIRTLFVSAPSQCEQSQCPRPCPHTDRLGSNSRTHIAQHSRHSAAGFSMWSQNTAIPSSRQFHRQQQYIAAGGNKQHLFSLFSFTSRYPFCRSFTHLTHSFTGLSMKLAASFIIVLLIIAASVAGHASGGKPALMARHARAAREAVSSVSRRHITTYVHRTCKPRPTLVSFTSFFPSS